MDAYPLPARLEILEEFLISFAKFHKTWGGVPPTYYETVPFGDDIPPYARSLSDVKVESLFRYQLYVMVKYVLNRLAEGELITAAAAKSRKLKRQKMLDEHVAQEVFGVVGRMFVWAAYCCERLTLTVYVSAPFDKYMEDILHSLWKAGYQPQRENDTDTWSVRVF